MIAHALDAIVAITALAAAGATIGVATVRPRVFDRLMGGGEGE